MWAWTRFRGESWRRRLFVRRLVRAGLVAVLLAVILPAAFIGANCYPIGHQGGAGTEFTIEYAIKGIYENTIGRLTAWFGRDTPEDQFAAKTAADYSKFVHELPWYEFGFGARLVRLWMEVPLWGAKPVRKIER